MQNNNNNNNNNNNQPFRGRGGRYMPPAPAGGRGGYQPRRGTNAFVRGASRAQGNPRGAAPGAPVNTPAQVIPPPIASPPKTTPGTAEQAVDKWYANFKVRISEASETKVQLTKIPYQTAPDILDGPNPHAVLAVYRTAATAWGFYRLWKMGARTCDLLWGSTRDEKIVKSLNLALIRAGFPADVMTVSQSHGHIIPLDINRRGPVGTGAVSQNALIVDVYQIGTLEDPVPLTPASVANLGYDNVVWVGHPFVGLYGAVDTATWVRRDGKIYWQPDGINPIYPPHFPADSMHSHGSTGQIAWAIKSTWHYLDRVVYDGLIFTKSSIQEYITPARTSLQGVMELDLPDHAAVIRLFNPKWLQNVVKAGLFWATDSAPWIEHLLPSKRVLLNQKHYTSLQDFLAGKSVNYYVWTLAYGLAIAILAADREFCAVRETFPMYFENYALDLTLAVITNTVETRGLMMKSLRVNYAESISDLNDSLRHIDKPVEAPSLSVFKHIVPTALIATWIIWRSVGRDYGKQGGLSTLSTAHSLLDRFANKVEQVKVTVKTHFAQPADKPIPSILNTLYNVVPHFKQFLLTATVRRDPVFAHSLIDAVHADSPNLMTVPSIVEATKDIVLTLFARDVLLAPVAEEMLKRTFGGKGKLVLSLLLTIGDLHGTNMTRSERVSRMCAHFLVHFGLAQLPLTEGIVFHSLINFTILYVLPYLINAHSLKPLSSMTAMGQFMKSSRFWIIAGAFALIALLGGQLFGKRSLPMSGSTVPSVIKQMLMQKPKKRQRLNNLTQALASMNMGESTLEAALTTDLVACDQFVAEQSFKPAVDCDDVMRPAQAVWIKVKDTLGEQSESPETSLGYYQWFSHPVPLFRPKISNKNLRAMVFHRLTRDVPVPDSELWRVATVLVLQHAATGTLPRLVPPPEQKLLALRDQYTIEDALYRYYGSLSQYSEIVLSEMRNLEMLHDGVYETAELDELTQLADFTLQYDHTHTLIYKLRLPFAVFANQAEGLYPEADLILAKKPANREVEFLEWLSHTDQSKRGRYRAAWKAINEQPLTLYSKEVHLIQVNIKHDEVLIKFPDATQVDQNWPQGLSERKKGFIPRPIHAVDPKLTVQIGVPLYRTVEAFKAHFQMAAIVQYQNYVVTGTMGAGLTADELSIWYEVARNSQGFHIIVAGDDSLVVFTPGVYNPCANHSGMLGRNAWNIFFEGDLSQCDHTNGADALLSEYTILRQFGLDIETIELLYANASADLVVGLKNRPGDAIRISRGPERNTGGTDTTIGNSCTVLTATTIAIVRALEQVITDYNFPSCTCDPNVLMNNEDFQQIMGDSMIWTFEALGLQLKMRTSACTSDDFTACRLPTFLKGTWYPVKAVDIKNAYVERLVQRTHLNVTSTVMRMWGPLPSRLLKMNKSFTDPRLLYNTPDLAHALACFKSDLTYSLKDYAWPPKITKWLVKESLGAPILSGETITAQWRSDAYGLFITAASKFSVTVLEAQSTAELAHYYGCEYEQLDDFFNRLYSVTQWEHFEHPVWWLLTRDYA